MITTILRTHIPIKTLSITRTTYRSIQSPLRAMSTATKFVAAVQAADPNLAGTNDQTKSEISKLSSEVESYTSNLDQLDKKLTPLTYLHGNTPSLADISLYCHLHPTLLSTKPENHPTPPSILRYFLQIQSLDAVKTAQAENPNSFQPLDIDVSTLPIPPRQVIAPIKKEKKAKAPSNADADTNASIPAAAAAAASSVVETVTAAATSAVNTATAAATSAAETIKTAVVGESGSTPAPTGDKAKKEKKEKKEKPKPVAKEETGPLPSMIDMRVGKVLDVKRHPDADSLYVESIDVGEEEPRTVCSGLVKYMTEDEIRGATIIVICNLKPVTMRGVKSYAMLLCASHTEGDNRGVEFVLPPEGSQPGERVYFEGEKYENATPESQLNPKKKVFETIQPNFTTLENRDAAWIDPVTKTVHLIRTKDGVLKAKSFVGASLS